MADNILDILIKFGLDKSKAQEAAKEIETLGKKGVESQEKTGKATDESSKKIDGMRKAVNMLEGQFGSLGRVAGMIMSPQAFGVAGLAVAIGEVRSALANFHKELDDMEALAGTALGPTKDKLVEIQVATAAADKAFKDYQTTTSDKSREMLSDINAQFDALKKILAAEKAIALARSGDKEKTEEQFRQLESSLGLEEKRAVMQQRQKEFQETITKGGEKLAEAQKNLRTLNTADAERALKTNPATLEAVDLVIARAEAKLKKMPETIPTDDDPLFWGLFGREMGPNPERVELEQRIRGMRDYRGTISDEKLRLTTGIAAQNAADTLARTANEQAGGIKRTSADIASEEVVELRRRVVALESERARQGVAVDAAEQRGDWRALEQAANAMDNIGAQITNLAQRIVEVDKRVTDMVGSLRSR